jgi:hypothetical protein
LQPTKNPIFAQRSLPLPMEPLSPRGVAQATSPSSSDEREDLQWSDEEEVERGPIWVLVDTSYDDSKFVKQNEIQDHVPLKHRTPRKSARGASGEGRRRTATHRGTVISKRHHPLSSSLVGGSRSLPSSPSIGHHRPAVIIRHEVAPRPCSTSHPGAATSSSVGSIGGTTSSAGGALGGPLPSSTDGSNRATSSSVSSCNKVSGAPSTKKRRLD